MQFTQCRSQDEGTFCQSAVARLSDCISLTHFALIASSQIFPLAMISIVLVSCLGVFVRAPAPALAAERGEAGGPAGLVTFDIPAQPLASALEAYGAATGIEVFYDAALAAGHWSSGVKGSLLPLRGLEVLLHGTGYVQHVTGTGTISIVPTPQETAQQVVASKREFDRYDPYFTILQARLSRTLCHDDHADTGSGEIIFKFWLTATGVITRASIVASGGDPERDQTITNRVEGLDVGKPPPAGLPEPVTMAVFPPAKGEALGCTSSRDGGDSH
jgi:hypothetical protein